MEYLGSVKEEGFVSWSLDAQDEFLVNKKYFSSFQSVGYESSNEDGTRFAGIPNVYLRASDKVSSSIYKFLTHTYRNEINIILLNQIKQLEDSVFGIQDKREIINLNLLAFNHAYDKIKQDKAVLFKKVVDENGITKFTTMGRFFDLFSQKAGMQHQLSQKRELIINFLVGNEQYFDLSLLKSNDFINKIVNFEGYLVFLININKDFKFEEDLYFSQTKNLKSIYEEYGHCFQSYENFLFVYEAIDGFKKNINSNIESLYAAGISLKIIDCGKSDFMKYLLKIHGENITKIRGYEKIRNESHEKRILKHKKNWHAKFD